MGRHELHLPPRVFLSRVPGVGAMSGQMQGLRHFERAGRAFLHCRDGDTKSWVTARISGLQLKRGKASHMPQAEQRPGAAEQEAVAGGRCPCSPLPLPSGLQEGCYPHPSESVTSSELLPHGVLPTPSTVVRACL